MPKHSGQSVVEGDVREPEHAQAIEDRRQVFGWQGVKRAFDLLLSTSEIRLELLILDFDTDLDADRVRQVNAVMVHEIDELEYPVDVLNSCASCAAVCSISFLPSRDAPRLIP